MLIREFDYNLDEGFAWILVEGKNPDETMNIQCCLNKNANDEFIKGITMSDCGHNWGQCHDTNEEAFNYWGENRCMKALFAKAKENGFDVEMAA